MLLGLKRGWFVMMGGCVVVMLEDKGKKGRRQRTYDVCVGGDWKREGNVPGENSFSIIRYTFGT